MKRFLVATVPNSDNNNTSVDEEQDEQQQQKKKLKKKRRFPRTFLSVNVDGLTSKLHDGKKWKEKQSFLDYVRKARADVVTITETWIPSCGATSVKPYSNDGTNKSYRESANGIKSALDLDSILKRYKRVFNCYHQKSAGVLVLVNAEEVEAPSKVSVRVVDRDGDYEDDEITRGRFVECQFGADDDANKLVVLSTYSPNNGSTTQSRERRRKWDEEVIMKRLTRLREEGTNFILTGDLNVAPESIDVKFDDIRAVENRKASDPDYGVAGFTRNEQRRFREILAAADACDAYRAVNGGEKRSYTWRSYTVNKVGGKVFNTVNPGMRLDLMVVSNALKSKILRCYHATDDLPDTEALKMPMDRFFGSDHCAVHLELKNLDDDDDDKDDDDA